MTKFLSKLLTEELVADILSKNLNKVELIKSKPAFVGWFVGKVMQASRGTANPITVLDILKRRLEL